MSADNQIKEARFKLFKGYQIKLEEVYTSSDETRQKLILSKLETLLDNLSAPVKQSWFDYQQAEEIRTNLSLSRKKLAEKVGIHDITIFKYEKGQLTPEKNKDSSKKYLSWLKQQGYKEKK